MEAPGGFYHENNNIIQLNSYNSCGPFSCHVVRGISISHDILWKTCFAQIGAKCSHCHCRWSQHSLSRAIELWNDILCSTGLSL